MKTTFIYILSAFILCANIIFAQTPYATHSIYTNLNGGCYGSQFINSDLGYAVVQGTNGARLAKTFNGGRTWQFSNLTNNSGLNISSFHFVDANTGYAYYYKWISKTTNGGINWVAHESTLLQGNSDNVIIKFRDANTGFISFRPTANSENLQMFRTTDGGSNWIEVLNRSSATYTYFIKDIAFDTDDPNTVALGGWSYNPNGGTLQYANYCLFISTNGGASFGNPLQGGFASNSTITSVDIRKNSNNVREFRFILNKDYRSEEDDNVSIREIYYATFDGSQITQTKIDNIYEGNSVYTGNGIKFLNANTGYVYAQSKIYMTTNGGVNWSVDKTISNSENTFHMKLSTYEDFVFASEQYGSLVVKKLNANLNSYRDNVIFNSSMIVDGNSFSTSGSAFIEGGNSITFGSNEYVNQGQTNEAVFYKWNNNATSLVTSNSILSNGNTISNNYKTKQYSTTPAAISGSNSVKTIKDTVLGGENRVHQVHESMGGIFYTKSTNNGSTFKSEEVVNRSSANAFAEGNKNPCVNVLRTLSSTKPLIYYAYNYANTSLKEKDAIVTWERYNSSTQKTEIKVARRNDNTWDIYNGTVSETFKAFSSASNYDSRPKIFAIGGISNPSDISNTFILVPHLEPSTNGGNKIVVTSAYSTLIGDYVVDEGNITDMSVIAPYNSNFAEFNLYFAYKKDGKIYYKYLTMGYYENHFYVINATTPLNISSGDGNITFRYSPDISLKNNLPIITYQGKYTVSKIVNFGESGTTSNISTTYYPVVVRYQKTSNPTDWSGFINQNSSGANIQSDPNIEGCTTGDSYLLNYKKSNAGYCQFVGLSNYHCDPPSFPGTDAKIVRGSYNSPVSTALLTTLSSETPLYRLGKQAVTVTNVNSQVQDGAYNNMKGIVQTNDANYIFSLGPIIIQRGNHEEEAEISTDINEIQPANAVEFNEYLRSAPFSISNNDTLIIGTNSMYKDYKGLDFKQLVYKVNLMNYVTNDVAQELFCDTVNIEDVAVTEFYRGYVMSNIEGGSAAYYIQIFVEGLDDIDAVYAYAGVYDGDEPTGDNMAAGKLYVDYSHSRNPVSSINLKPDSYKLSQNYPNPFNPSTTIKFSVPKDGLVKIRVYDISGKEVANLINEVKTTGIYEVKFNGANLASGMYFYRIEANDFVETKKMILIK